MNIKKKIVVCIITVFIAVILLLFGVAYIISFLPKNVQLEPIGDYEINYNNYCGSFTHKMDYLDELYYVDENSIFKSINKVNENKSRVIIRDNVKSIQRTEDYLFFTDNNDNLYRIDVNGKNKKLICKNTFEFLVCNGSLFTKETNDNDSFVLVHRNINGDVIKDVFEGIGWFGVYDNMLYFAQGEFDVNFYKYSIENKEYTKIGSIYTMHSSPNYNITNNRIVCTPTQDGNITAYDINSMKPYDIFVPDHMARYAMICNNDNVFISYQEIGHNGPIESDKNGLYCVNVVSGEKKKIDNNTYKKLYVFGEYIFGVRESDNEIYQISFDGKVVNKLVR